MLQAREAAQSLPSGLLMTGWAACQPGRTIRYGVRMIRVYVAGVPVSAVTAFLRVFPLILAFAIAERTADGFGLKQRHWVVARPIFTTDCDVTDLQIGVVGVAAIAAIAGI